MSDSDVLPCPFCGSKSALFRRADGQGEAVICNNYMCGVFISGTPVHPALPLWNKRVQPQPDSSSIPEVGKLKNLLRQAAEGMDTHYEETHPELVAAIKESCESSSISTEQTFENAWNKFTSGNDPNEWGADELAEYFWNASKGQSNGR
jgi:hypothetical protein